MRPGATVTSGPAALSESAPADHPAPGLLGRALARCGRDGRSGVLRVVGSPGGVFHLTRGDVVAVESPGAPGVGTLLLRSGRVGEDEWLAAHDANGDGRWPGSALVEQGCLGVAEHEVLCLVAAQDAAFAVIAGRMDDCVFLGDGPDGPPPFAGRAIAPELLLGEARRRLEALASLPARISPERERVVALPRDADAEDALSGGRRAILLCANGRRSARDIAFTLGRGVYSVTVEVSRMLSEGLVEIAAPEPVTAAPPVTAPTVGVAPAAPAAPEPLPLGPRSGPPEQPSQPSQPSQPDLPGRRPVTPEGLPQRLPGASGIHEALAPVRHPGSWKGLLRPRGKRRPDEPELEPEPDVDQESNPAAEPDR